MTSSSKHVGSALDDTLRITLVRRQSGVRTADLEVWATPELYWQHGLDWPWLLDIALIWISAIIIALWYLLWYLCHWLHTFLCKYRWNLAPLKSAWVGPCFMIFIFHLFNSNCLYLSFYSISIRLRGLAVKQLGAQGLCSKVTTRAWGPPKHQPHLRSSTNAYERNTDEQWQTQVRLTSLAICDEKGKQQNKNRRISSYCCCCLPMCTCMSWSTYPKNRPKTRQNISHNLTYLGQRALLWQWYLRHPFFSCEQHQSFLESDHPCFQLENPAWQS